MPHVKSSICNPLAKVAVVGRQCWSGSLWLLFAKSAALLVASPTEGRAGALLEP
jgi:hypothetical protein